MERKFETSQRDSARTSPHDTEKTFAAPHASAAHFFDDAAVRHARPAEPLRAGEPRRTRRARSWSPAVVLLVTLSAVAGGVVGGLVAGFFRAGPVVRSTSPTQRRAASAVEPSAATQRPADAATTTQQPAPPAAASFDPASAAPSEAVPSSSVETNAPAQPEVKREEETAARQPAPEAAADPKAAGDAHAELRGALGRWIEATNARNIERQMNFYGERVSAFYLTRNASREAVRAEKARVFGRASAVNVNAGEPEITVSPDGRTASMRFRKRYQIEGNGEGRRGEVLQELRWRRTANGWRIVSERDLRVIN